MAGRTTGIIIITFILVANGAFACKSEVSSSALVCLTRYLYSDKKNMDAGERFMFVWQGCEFYDSKGCA